jgi:hypothetical protein
MAPKFLRSALIPALTVVVLTLIWTPGAWAASKYKVLYSFQGGTDGADPYGGLTLDTAGNLYGATYYGGMDNAGCGSDGWTGCGTVFELSPEGDGWTKSLLYTFCSQNNCTDGASPNGDMVLDAAGALFGTTVYGGSSNYYGAGTAFKLAPDSKGGWRYSEIYIFQGGSKAGNPNGSMIFDQRGNLYGVAGAAFSLTRSSGNWTETDLYTFCSKNKCRGGSGPMGGLIWGVGGTLYGTTYEGGQDSFGCYFGCGVLFKLTHKSKDKWKENVLHTLAPADGAYPVSALISDGHGNLYGTTTAAGAFGAGTAFNLRRDSNGRWKYSVLHEFGAGYMGDYLFRSGLALDQAGNLYGTAWTYGTGNCAGESCGLVYKLAPGPHDGWKYSELYSFTGGLDGGVPNGGLILDKNGNLYGVAEMGGANGYGVVFEVTP